MTREYVIERRYPTYTPVEVCLNCRQSKASHNRVARLVEIPEAAAVPWEAQVFRSTAEMEFVIDLQCPRSAFRNPEF